VSGDLDRPNIYAAKRMFDGQRHIWVGWVWDIPSGHDGGDGAWGGTMCLPREVYAGPNGQLYSKPAREVVAVFDHTVLTLRDKPRFLQSPAKWLYDGAGLKGQSGSLASQIAFHAPDNYLFECRCRLDADAKLTITMRSGGSPREEAAGGYRLTLDPARRVLSLGGNGFRYERACPIDTATPVKVQAFVQGTIIECFLNDQYAQTCRAYDCRSGTLGLTVTGGSATFTEMTVKIPAPR
jgi:beta-fructofuranosidase